MMMTELMQLTTSAAVDRTALITIVDSPDFHKKQASSSRELFRKRVLIRSAMDVQLMSSSHHFLLCNTRRLVPLYPLHGWVGQFLRKLIAFPIHVTRLYYP